MTQALPLSKRFREALDYATVVHGGHARKGTSVPYISHLLAVCALVLEDGGDEIEAIAALLHDAVEDRGGRERLEDIRCQFGKQVADIVDSCSNTLESEKEDWRERKAGYIARIQHASRKARRVSCADKVHNVRSILQDYRKVGKRVWNRFNAGREGHLWYYKRLTRIFLRRGPTRLAEELRRRVTELESLTAPHVKRSRTNARHGRSA